MVVEAPEPLREIAARTELMVARIVDMIEKTTPQHIKMLPLFEQLREERDNELGELDD